jgi:L-ascorbate metabolism protein UlaG (beta-lactamase superfamily)
MNRRTDPREQKFRFTLIGGPTALLEYAGMRILLDPTFSPPGEYPSSTGALLTKTEGPALSVEQVGHVDLVLLSHDQHPDNLDPAGRALLPHVPLVLTTVDGADRLALPNTYGLENWQDSEVDSTGGRGVRVTGLPATHGPDGVVRPDGTVTGFLLEAEGEPRVYVSGDNASLATVRTIANRVGGVGIAVLFTGAARTGAFDNAPLTLTSQDAVEAARILGAGTVLPVHYRGWAHFSETSHDLVTAFDTAGLADLTIPDPGSTVAPRRSR